MSEEIDNFRNSEYIPMNHPDFQPTTFKTLVLKDGGMDQSVNIAERTRIIARNLFHLIDINRAEGARAAAYYLRLMARNNQGNGTISMEELRNIFNENRDRIVSLLKEAVTVIRSVPESERGEKLCKPINGAVCYASDQLIDMEMEHQEAVSQFEIKAGYDYFWQKASIWIMLLGHYLEEVEQKSS